MEDNVGTEISLRDFLFCDKYKEQIEHIRSIKDEEQQKSLKKQLPLAAISGTFAPTRKADNLVAHSNLLCVDIDKKDNMGVSWFDDLKHEWHNIPQILYAGRSIRGEGWFAIFHIAYPEKHRAHFEALQRDFANSGLVVDKFCKDVSRMRTISYDPEPYVNEAATLYTKVWVEPKPTIHIPYSGGDDIAQVEKCCCIIADRGIDITATYDDWFHVGVALASLGERGRSLFIWLARKMRSTKQLRQIGSSTTSCVMSVASTSVHSSISVRSIESIGRRTDYESEDDKFRQCVLQIPLWFHLV